MIFQLWKNCKLKKFHALSNYFSEWDHLIVGCLYSVLEDNLLEGPIPENLGSLSNLRRL